MKTAACCLALSLLCADLHAQSCVASTPFIEPKASYCSGKYCGSTPDAAAFARYAAHDVPAVELTNGPIACEVKVEPCGPCQALQLDTANDAWCPYWIRTNSCTGYPIGSCAQPFWVAVARECAAGYIYNNNGTCQSIAAFLEDGAIRRDGGIVQRDVHGNRLAVQNPPGVTITSAGNFDEFGRPGVVDGAKITWPADGGILPESIAMLEAPPVRLHWQDYTTVDQADLGGGQYKFTYWPNGSVHTLASFGPGPLALQTWRENGSAQSTQRFVQIVKHGPTPVTPPTFTISAAPTFSITAAATPVPQPAAPTPRVGVHQITMQPGGSLFQVGTIMVGASLLYPPASKGLVDWMTSAWNACFPQAAVSSDRIQQCEAQYIADEKACADAVEAKYRNRPRIDPLSGSNRADADMMECLSSASQRRSLCKVGGFTDIPPLQLPR